MAKIPMTKDRDKTGIPKHKANDKTRARDPETGLIRDYTFKSERIIKDDDDNIIGVETLWQ